MLGCSQCLILRPTSCGSHDQARLSPFTEYAFSEVVLLITHQAANSVLGSFDPALLP